MVIIIDVEDSRVPDTHDCMDCISVWLLSQRNTFLGFGIKIDIIQVGFTVNVLLLSVFNTILLLYRVLSQTFTQSLTGITSVIFLLVLAFHLR